MSLPHESMPERLHAFVIQESSSVQDVSGVPMILPVHHSFDFVWRFGDFGNELPVRSVDMGVIDDAPRWAMVSAQEQLDHMIDRYNWWEWARQALGAESEAYNRLIEPPFEAVYARSSEYEQIEIEAFRFDGGFDKEHFARFRALAKKVIDTANISDDLLYHVNLCIVPSDEPVRMAIARQGRVVLLLSDEVFMAEPTFDLSSFVRVYALGIGYHNARRDTDPFVSSEEFDRPWGLRTPIGTVATIVS